MRGNQLVLDALARSAEREIAAITAYVVHASIQEKWGLGKIAKESMSRARKEMEHLDRLIDRTIELDGIPPLYRASDFTIGQTVREHIEAGLVLENQAVELYNNFVMLCCQVGDETTRDLFSELVKDETEHVVYLEANMSQIAMMTEAGWLQTLV